MSIHSEHKVDQTNTSKEKTILTKALLLENNNYNGKLIRET